MYDREPTPPMRRIKYEEGHAIGGYFPNSSPAFFTNKRHARSAALEDVREYLEALGAYDDNGVRYPASHEDHVAVSKEGDYKWRLTFGHGGSRYVYVDTVDDDLWFDAEGDVYERKESDDGTVTWEWINQDW